MAVSDYVFVQIAAPVGRGDIYWMFLGGSIRNGGFWLDSARWEDGN